MSSVLFVVNVIDTDLVTPSKRYEGIGFDFESLYNAALDAVVASRKKINRQSVKKWFDQHAAMMKRTGGFIHADYECTVEVYASRYEICLSAAAGARKRRIGDSPPRDDEDE